MDTYAALSAKHSTRPSVTPVVFSNQDGLPLFGVLHQPPVVHEGAETVLILSPGVKMRVAPHRLYNKLADRLVAMGHPVLRFDFHGLGDSGGEAPEPLLADFYGATQLGRYVPDTVAAMDWMQRTYGARRFLAAGLCGGALTGLLTAAKDPRIVGLFAISIPVILDGANRDASKHMTVGQLSDIRSGYLRKLRTADWRAWVRLLSFRSDYRMIGRALFKPIQTLVNRSQSGPTITEPADPGDNTNPLFAPAFKTVVASSRHVRLVFGETDRLSWEFEDKFMKRHCASLEPYSQSYRVHVIPSANHIFSASQWQDELFAQCSSWLEGLGQKRNGAVA